MKCLLSITLIGYPMCCSCNCLESELVLWTCDAETEFLEEEN